jgi:hypothetical protein
VSDVDVTEISVMALVLFLLSNSRVNRLIIFVSMRFFTLLLIADSDSPISLAISTNG